MQDFLIRTILGFLAKWPLPWLHSLGALGGRIIFLLDHRFADRIRENLGIAGQTTSLTHVLKELGKGAIELPWIWLNPLPKVVSRVRHVIGFDAVKSAYEDRKGIIMLTPHMGCFEIISLWVADKLPLSVMYSPPENSTIDGIMKLGRARGNGHLVPADINGVRKLFKALKQGELIGILPDQVPSQGDGVWAPFFGKPAYTMTLVQRLQEKTGAAVFICYGERLPGGRYDLYFFPYHGSTQPVFLNRLLEQYILKLPSQYLWSYNRYKVPAGVQPPDTFA